MPWFPMDTHYLDDPKIEAAREATPFALSVFPALLAKAKLRSDGGRVEVSYGKLGFELGISAEQAAKSISALVAARILEVESIDDRSARVAFPAATWRRWNENFRKQQSRDAQAA